MSMAASSTCSDSRAPSSCGETSRAARRSRIRASQQQSAADMADRLSQVMHARGSSVLETTNECGEDDDDNDSASTVTDASSTAGSRRSRVRASQQQSISEMADRLAAVMEARGSRSFESSSEASDETEAASTKHDMGAILQSIAEESPLCNAAPTGSVGASRNVTQGLVIDLGSASSNQPVSNQASPSSTDGATTTVTQEPRKRFTFPKPVRRSSAMGTGHARSEPAMGMGHARSEPARSSARGMRFVGSSPNADTESVFSSAVSSPCSEGLGTGTSTAYPQLKSMVSSLLTLRRGGSLSSAPPQQASSHVGTTSETACAAEVCLKPGESSHQSIASVEPSRGLDSVFASDDGGRVEPEPGPEPDYLSGSGSPSRASARATSEASASTPRTLADPFLFSPSSRLIPAPQRRESKTKHSEKAKHRHSK